MPKIKTNRSAAKRFYKVTATGKVKRARGGKSHSNEKKGRKRKGADVELSVFLLSLSCGPMGGALCFIAFGAPKRK